MGLAGWFASVALVVGLSVMTLGVVGMFRMPTLLTKLHAASKSVVLGVALVLLAVAVAGDAPTAAKAALTAAILLLTTPVSAHVIATTVLPDDRAARRDGGDGRER
ncbi:MAG TPA: monovalent cation/H(+) antiporter subunit G [Thermomicrobiales bacterium]|jgi:multicomponent Na+:H+ antiporter subunit G|nr:monovalent cation/H(+) antiporter subunit G [Thermomicrobiales bacterium]